MQLREAHLSAGSAKPALELKVTQYQSPVLTPQLYCLPTWSSRSRHWPRGTAGLDGNLLVPLEVLPLPLLHYHGRKLLAQGFRWVYPAYLSHAAA